MNWIWVKKYKGFLFSSLFLGLCLPVFFWMYPDPLNPQTDNEIKTQYISAFDLAEKIDIEGTSLEKQEIVDGYIDFLVKDEGFILDVVQEKEIPYLKESYIAVDIINTLEKTDSGFYSGLSIKCKFSDEWRKVLLATKRSEKVKFTGIITDEGNYRHSFNIFPGTYVPVIVLDNCSILN